MPVCRAVRVLLIFPRTSDFQRVLKLSCCLSRGHRRAERARVSDGGTRGEGGREGEWEWREGGREGKWE